MSAGGHGPGHSMPALLQRAVVSTVSTLDIYTPQSHRTPGPDNTLPSHHSREGQSDFVRLRDIGQVNEPHFHNTANTMKIA